jgi:hypothetical protein
LLTVSAHTGGVSCLVLLQLSSGSFCLSGGAQGDVQLRALSNGALHASASELHSGRVTALAVTKDASHAYSSGGDSAIRLLLPSTSLSGVANAPLACACSVLVNEGPVTLLELSHDATLLVSASASGSLHAWRAADLTPTSAFPGHAGPLSSLALPRSAELLASACPSDGSVRLWPLRGGEPKQVLTAPPGEGGDRSDEPGCLAATADCGCLFVGYASGSIRAWRTVDGVCTAHRPPAECNNPAALQPTPLPAGCVAIALSHGEDRLAACFSDGCVRLLRARDLAVTHSLFGHKAAAPLVRLCKDGATVVAGGAEGCLRAWRPGGMPSLPTFSRAACLTLDSRTPGCVPQNLQRVIAQMAKSAVGTAKSILDKQRGKGGDAQ